MSNQSNDSTLNSRQYITFIVRLGLDEGGQIIQGELVDTVGSRPKHFIDLKGLHQAVEVWLKDTSRKYISSSELLITDTEKETKQT